MLGSHDQHKEDQVLVVGRDAASSIAKAVIVPRSKQLQAMSHFRYLGGILTSDCTLDAEIIHRVVAANSAFQ